MENLQNYKNSSQFEFACFDFEDLFLSISLNKVIFMVAELLLNKFETISQDKIKNYSNFEYKMFNFILVGRCVYTKNEFSLRVI